MRGRKLLGAGFAGMLAMAGVATTVVATSVPAGATTITVTNTADDGSPTSLRYLVQTADPGDVLELVPGATYELTRCEVDPPEAGAQFVLSAGELWVFEPITIQGNGAAIVQTCDGSRVIHTEASLTLDGVTVTGGTATSGGGGIRVDSGILSADSGTEQPLPQGEMLELVINDSSIVDNCTTSNGGGIKMNVNGNVEITNSTIAGNRASSVGGGFSHSHQGDLLMVNSTVTGNSSYDHSGVDVRNGDFTAVYSDIVGNVSGVYSGDCGVAPFAAGGDDDEVVGATIEAANVYVNVEYEFVAFGTVVADPGEADNCSTSTSSSGYNFADDDTCGFTTLGDRQGAGLDPMLGSLASNGGPTQTLLPQAGSPLIDGIPNADCVIGDLIAGYSVTTDQRGLARPEQTGGACDVGSVEVQAEAVALEPNFTG